MNHVTDDAVGLSWFVAIVRHNTENKVADYLVSQGFEIYIASQPRLRISPSGRKKWVKRLVISSKVFIHCSEKQRRQVLNHPFIYRFLTDPSGEPINGHRPIAVIPDKEIETLRYMLGQSDYPVDFQEISLQPGDPVKIIRGSLKGLEGKVIETSDTHKTLLVQLDLLGSARLTIPVSDISSLK